MLLFDCLTAVPAELAEKVLSYLDINSLCAATLCCRKWRDLTNNDCLWSVILLAILVYKHHFSTMFPGFHFVDVKAMSSLKI